MFPENRNCRRQLKIENRQFFGFWRLANAEWLFRTYKLIHLSTHTLCFKKLLASSGWLLAAYQCLNMFPENRNCRRQCHQRANGHGLTANGF
jgi:hypothetical protein